MSYETTQTWMNMENWECIESLKTYEKLNGTKLCLRTVIYSWGFRGSRQRLSNFTDQDDTFSDGIKLIPGEVSLFLALLGNEANSSVKFHF